MRGGGDGGGGGRKDSYHTNTVSLCLKQQKLDI